MIKSGDIEPHMCFLKDLISHHPRQEKVSGLADVSLNEACNGLLILRGGDGEVWETVNLKICAVHKCRGKKPSHRTLCLEAMRTAVINQITVFRRSMGYSGKGREFHVGHDHELGESFVELAERFVSERSGIPEGSGWEGLSVVKSDIKAPQGNKPWILQKEQADEWRKFHGVEAKLRMERAEDNLRSSK
jgi:hypothetical protein